MGIFNWKPKLVLPTVYDDALSYQEILGKVIDALNQMGETGKLANVVSPLENPVLQITEKGVVLTGKANIVYGDGNNTDTDISITYPIAAGDNIIFGVEEGKLVITGTGTNYGAGEGIKITGTIIGCDFAKVQAKLTAGEGIVLDGSTISIDPAVIGSGIVAGDGIKVNGNTVSVDYTKVQGKLSAGDGIKLAGNNIGADYEKVQKKLTAGEGIAIENEVIKATGNGKEVTVSLPEGGTSGTLDETQFNTLIASDNNWVTVNNERYILMDKEHTPGIRVYTHDGLSGLGTVKYLSLTVNTRAFTIVEDYLTPRVILEGTEGTIDEDKRSLVNNVNCVIILTPDLPIKYFRFIGKDNTNLVYACQYNQTLTRMVINDTTYAWSLVDTVFENAVNKVTSLSASNTNAQYPSAKVTYDEIQKVTGIANSATAKANDASEVATSARSTANSAKTAAEQADTKAGEAKTQAASALETADQASAAANLAKSTADTASTTATNAKTTADEAKALAQTNETTISEVQETIPTFQLSGTTLTINMPN